MNYDDLLAKLHATSGRRRMMQAPREPDPEARRRGRNNRARGNAASLEAARMFGGQKVEELKLPWDVQGDEWASQVKSFTGLPPGKYKAPRAVIASTEPRALLCFRWTSWPRHGYFMEAPSRWAALFDAMRTTSASRTPRILERYAQRGARAEWFAVIESWRSDDPSPMERLAVYWMFEGRDWLDAFGRDAPSS